MDIKKQIKKTAKALIYKLRGSNDKAKIVKFKKDIWQTEKLSKAFIKGSDAEQTSLAAVMDREVNAFFLGNCLVTDKVLDIGCGHGIVSEYLASNGINTTAIDISEALLDEFKKRIEGKALPINIIRGDAYNIPCDNNVFDIVVARMFLPHFPDWPLVLKEMARVTRLGGKILVHFVSKENSDLAVQIGREECKFESSPVTNNPWEFYAETDSVELRKVSKNLGLKVTKRTPVSFFSSNRAIGRQLGQELYDQYQKELSEKLKDENVMEFIVWFDRLVTYNCEPAFSYFNIITFEKEN